MRTDAFPDFIDRACRAVYRRKWAILCALLVCATLVWFIWWYVGKEMTIYYWDTSAYWMRTTGLADWIRSDSTAALRGVLHTIRHDEYNSLFALPLSLFSMIFGSSRLVYVLGVFFLYFLPATILMATVIVRLLPRPKFIVANKGWYLTIVWSVVALNPIVILPVLGGYPDVVGLIPISIATLCYLKARRSNGFSQYFLIAVMLIAATFLRRWYVFASAGIILSIAIDQLVLSFESKKRFWRVVLSKFLKFCTLPIVFSALFITIAPDYVHQLMTTNYIEKYAAYKFHHNYLELLGMVVAHYGIILFVLSVVGIIWVMHRNKYRNRKLVAALLAIPTFCFFAVGRVQTFDTHQYYLLTPMFLFGIVANLHLFADVFSKHRTRAFVVGYSLLILAIYLPTAFVVYDSGTTIAGFTNIKSPPAQRKDLANLRQLYSDVERLNKTKQNQSNTIYVLACSFNLNVDLFRNIPLSLNYKTQRIEDDDFTPSAIFDVAQGFDTRFFSSNVIVDSTPVGYITSNTNEQKIIVYLHEQLGVGGEISQYYSVAHRYRLDSGYEATIYVRTQLIPDEVKQQMVDTIRSFHKDVPIYP